MQTQATRIFNLFPNGNNPTIISIPQFDQLVDENGLPVSSAYPIPYEKLDDEIIIHYDGESMTLTEFKQRIVSLGMNENSIAD